MSTLADTRPVTPRRFRLRLFVAMMLVVSVLTSLGIFFAQKNAADDAQNDLERDFQLELAALHRLQDLRKAAVADRSSALARNARIHAALEDNALDLLYPSAAEELRDLMGEGGADTLHARFYRFLDGRGAVIPPPPGLAGRLLPNEQAQLAQPAVPRTMQAGYLARTADVGDLTIDEMIAVPIRSTETNEVIAALVLGFKPVEVEAQHGAARMRNGILVGGKLQLPAFDRATQKRVIADIEKVAAHGAAERAQSLRVVLEETPHLLFFKRLNPQSNYPPAYEVSVYPLTELLARQRHLRTQVLSGGVVLLLVGLFVSHLLSRRLARPVEKLAVVSEENRARRQVAEAQLQTTAEELQRSARFSADASHQLKSPITVLRAGLDSLLTREGFSPEIYEDISLLIHQTYRLTGVVEDLLLLSRMDAGKLRLNLHPVDLAQLVLEWLDDLRALPEASDLTVESDLPEELRIAGERKYTSLILQNLLDNARKYNCRGGTIRITSHALNGEVELRVANTGRGIPPDSRADIFERFQRASTGEDVSGHGLGLNLARELARLHGGELSLVRSDAEWTEFCAVFLPAGEESK